MFIIAPSAVKKLRNIGNNLHSLLYGFVQTKMA